NRCSLQVLARQKWQRRNRGMLKVTGSYGDMSLPAAKNVREGADEDGNKITVINIWGSGDITLVMPDEAAIEACVRQTLTPEQTADSDIVFSTIFPCAASAPATTQPIPVKASVEISIFESPSAMVNVKRTYAKGTTLPGGTITLEPLPPPSCTVQ
ncbi:MAG TPA: hypothetical protein VFP29_13460, partial [Methyloceanibacter sp.]|nr:hypothetical protein [Methyloceanibacter sp.]